MKLLFWGVYLLFEFKIDAKIIIMKHSENSSYGDISPGGNYLLIVYLLKADT
jgi:hypothetical protein